MATSPIHRLADYPNAPRSIAPETSWPDSAGGSPKHSATSLEAIVAQGVAKAFPVAGESVWVLQGIDLAIPSGTLHFLMGPSGVGKTTLLSILAGILTPTAGQIRLLGADITRLSPTRSAQFRLMQTGFIFQELNLLASLTALENVELVLHLRGVNAHQARRQAMEMLERLQMGHRAHQLPRSLSGGEKQRVAVARGLVGEPPIVFADEPTAALDSHNGQIVITLLRELVSEQHCTVLMATHDHRFTQFADRVLVLEDGRILT